MRIVDVNPFFYPYRGGIEHRMHDTCRLLAERGHDVTILTGRLPGTEGTEERDGYKIVRLRSRLINIYNPPFISSKDVLGTLNGLDADIVNYNYRWAPSYNKDLMRYTGKKVFTYHNMWGEGTGMTGRISNFQDNRFRRCLDTFDHIICVSDFVKDDLTRRGIPKDRTTAIPSCLNGFPEIGAGDGGFILSLGRLVRTKGLDHLIEAMRRVDAKLIICGKGPERGRLEKLIKKYGLEERVEMRGYVSEEEKAMLMGSCGFFVMPSIFESFGLAAVEVMSYGRPIVCTDVNGLGDTVREGGVIVPPKDPAALADAMNRLLDDKNERMRLAAAARAQAERFDWKDHIEKIEDVYRNVIG
ncbi:MAG: glycosyltransferase family 4 protein [Methanomassiliicoccaceae archaeon]|jgi:glycosyltransferase involved in cell wall biosynthesis|nr:glycosyltransferase family 4 protein [Methanomassiliicoccaceae archaeon]